MTSCCPAHAVHAASSPPRPKPNPSRSNPKPNPSRSCYDARCCKGHDVGCFKRPTRQFAQCRHYHGSKGDEGGCRDTEDWLCPGTWEICSPTMGSCQQERCCDHTDHACYAKDDQYAQCLPLGTCTGKSDPAGKQWSCEVLTPRPPESPAEGGAGAGGGGGGTVAAVLLIALLAMVAAGGWGIWRHVHTKGGLARVGVRGCIKGLSSCLGPGLAPAPRAVRPRRPSARMPSTYPLLAAPT